MILTMNIIIQLNRSSTSIQQMLQYVSYLFYVLYDFWFPKKPTAMLVFISQYHSIFFTYVPGEMLYSLFHSGYTILVVYIRGVPTFENTTKFKPRFVCLRVKMIPYSICFYTHLLFNANRKYSNIMEGQMYLQVITIPWSIKPIYHKQTFR